MHLEKAIQYIHDVENKEAPLIVNDDQSEVEYFKLKHQDSDSKFLPNFKQSNYYSNHSLNIQKPFINKILIVDDEIFNIESLKAILKSMQMNINLHVDHAMSGEEALQKIMNDVE